MDTGNGTEATMFSMETKRGEGEDDGAGIGCEQQRPRLHSNTICNKFRNQEQQQLLLHRGMGGGGAVLFRRKPAKEKREGRQLVGDGMTSLREEKESIRGSIWIEKKKIDIRSRIGVH